MTNKTILIGLDSVDYELVKKWSSEGFLPYFKQLLEKDTLVELDSHGDIMQGSVYTTLAVGVSPGKHGMYLDVQLHDGEYDVRKTYSDHVSCEPFYKTMADNGINCAIIDVPGDRPLATDTLFQIIDWGTEFKYWKFDVQPAESKEDIVSKFGYHPFTNYKQTKGTQEYQRKLRGMIESGIEQKGEMIRSYIKQDNLDFIFAYFCELHKAGHFFWKYYDRDYVDFEPSDEYLENGLRGTYIKLDEQLKKIAESKQEKDNLVVFAEHGMGPGYRGEHLIQPFLEKLGLLARTGTSNAVQSDDTVYVKDPTRWQKNPARRRVESLGRTLFPKQIKNILRPLFRKVTGAPAEVDWLKTRAFTIQTDRNSYIRINLKGREKQGIVHPADYDRLIADLEKELKALINPRTGKPAVAEVHILRKLFPGPHADDLPDISVFWNGDEGPIWAITSPTIGTIEGKYHEFRTGNHNRFGFMFAEGPDFCNLSDPLKGDVLQIAPTFLKLYNIQPPADYEMFAINKILKIK